MPVELSSLITAGFWILVALLSGLAGVAKYWLEQMNKRQDDRFAALEEARTVDRENAARQLSKISDMITRQDQARENGKQHWDAMFADLNLRMADHRDRISRLETTVEHCPTHDDLGKVHDRITEVGQNVSNLTGEFAGANRTLSLIHTFLLSRGEQ